MAIVRRNGEPDRGQSVSAFEEASLYLPESLKQREMSLLIEPCKNPEHV